MQRRAWIQPRAKSIGQARAFHRGRIGERSVAADEFTAVPGDRPGGIIHVEERDAPAEFRVVRVARTHGATGRLDLGDHMHRHSLSQLAEHPLDVAGSGQAPGAA